MSTCGRWVAIVSVLFAAIRIDVSAARSPSQNAPNLRVERLDQNRVRIGSVIVDTSRREVSVPGTVNPVNDMTALEFVANTPRGAKAYESALTLDVDALTFNAALLLIGVDKTNARPPTQHFDPADAAGSPVEVVIEWMAGSDRRRAAPEELLFDKGRGTSIAKGGWVYTGSRFTSDGSYMAELDGVLIGFVHDPVTIIERVSGAGLGRYGSIVFNTNLGLSPGSKVTLSVRALTPAR